MVDIRQKLRQRFASAGLSESQPSEVGSSSDLFFIGEGTSVRVVVLERALWADRQAIMDSVMRASASAGKVSRTYLALPKTAASITDARLFQERGIGLFTYDQRNIEEALPARYFENASPIPPQVNGAATNELENELRELRAEFDMLQRDMRQLKEELASSKNAPTPSQIVTTFTARTPLPEVQVAENLPTFFTGNPWVEVLSKRGREEPAFVG